MLHRVGFSLFYHSFEIKHAASSRGKSCMTLDCKPKGSFEIQTEIFL